MNQVAQHSLTPSERARELRIALKTAMNALDAVTMRAILADPNDCSIDDMRALFAARDAYIETAERIRKTTLRSNDNGKS